VGVRMHDDLLVPLDKWVSLKGEKLGRSEAIRLIVRDRLIAEGLITPPDSSSV